MTKLLKGEFKKINNSTYFLKYENDYGLNKLLERGTSNVADLCTYAQKFFGAQKDDIDIRMGGTACTTFNATTENGDHLLARNFDYKDAATIVVWTAPENGYKSVAFTDPNVMLHGKKLGEKENLNRLLAAPYTCMDGINEKGLAIAVLELKTKATKQQTGKKPIITTVMIRAVLDKCATIEEAIELFQKYDMHASLFCDYHFHIADASGKSVVVEYINNKIRFIYPTDKYQYALNFYATPNYPIEKGFGYTREKWLHEEFEETNHIMNEERAMKILERCKLYYKHKRGYMITCLWSVVYNCNARTALLCTGMDYNTKYELSVDYKG